MIVLHPPICLLVIKNVLFQAANYEFYENLEQSCCSKLDHLELPVFKPSTSEIKAGKIQTSRDTTKSPISRKDSTKLDVTAHMSNLSLALSLGELDSKVRLSHLRLC
jgi:protein SMG8